MNLDIRKNITIPIIFGGVFVAAFGFLWGAIEAYAYFELNWFSGVTTKTLAAVILLLLSINIGLVAVVIKTIFPRKHAHGTLAEYAFDQSLVKTLASAIKNKNYAEAIRIGIALNRPLFEAGNFVTRLKIGRIVEEASALTGRKDVQVVALIDSIGWSLVELGEYVEAQRSIEHGIDICRGINDEFYEAKGYRHLGVIARRTEKYKEAAQYYKQSMEHAGKIEDQHDKKVLIAGLHYAYASLYYFTKDFDNASIYIDKAIACFELLNDEYRYNMSLVMKGDIEYKKGKNDDAKDIYRRVLRQADRNTEKLQVARSCLGLAEVYLSDHQWEKAAESIRYIKEMDLKDFKSEKVRLDLICSKLPKQDMVSEIN
ncbi:MAG: tetratricopeptide repeat protein [Candidatus Marinimicrobia bacterium]|nr:tetratricopeptide repeat protein [Candidatus Neomarinimicrobiota bacterium]